MPSPEQAGDYVVCLDVHVLRNLHAVAVVLCLLHVELTARSRQDGRNELVVCLDCAALASKRIDEYLDSFAPLRRSVCAIEQLLYPCLRYATVGFVEGVADDGRANGLLRCVLRILDGDMSIL